MDKVYLDKEQKNICYTKVSCHGLNDVFPASIYAEIPPKSYNIYSSVISFTAKEMTYEEITRTFSCTSSCGAKYINIIYDHHANAFIVHTLKSRQAQEIVNTWTNLYQ